MKKTSVSQRLHSRLIKVVNKALDKGYPISFVSSALYATLAASLKRQFHECPLDALESIDRFKSFIANEIAEDFSQMAQEGICGETENYV